VDAPVPSGLQFALNGTATPLIRPRVDLPRALPALVSPSVAAQAVDGLVRVDLAGRELAVRVAAVADRFPTVVRRADDFAVLDYDTLFAALNADRPGFVSPREAWFFGARPQRAAAHLVGAEPLRKKLLGDPLARGTRDVLDVTALLAAALAVLGLLVGVRSTLGADRLLAAEYEALGVPPSTLARSVQLRLALLSVLGIGAGLLGGVLAVRLVGALVAVTGTGAAPLPSIVPVVAWLPLAALLGAVGAVALTVTLWLARTAYRTPAATRLTA
jgi:putative ABC transport system permease protein